MRILTMSATFGKLDGATLNLKNGLNVVCAPNEWGKSTWCAFLCAMLYGIDTKARGAKGQLTEKEKYAPWSGKPMEGSIRLVWQGRDITIQRRTKGRIPMGEFLAYESKTGIPVPELTADNCGMMLLGVERSVFQRTGFVRLADLTAPADDVLRSRLRALVTTGDDSGSAQLLAKGLKELKNRCRYNKTGLIPECSREIQQLQAQLADGQTASAQITRLEQQIAGQTAELNALRLHRDTLLWEQSRQDQALLEEAEEAAAEAAEQAALLEERCGAYPSRSVLDSRIQKAEDFLRQAAQEIPSGISPVPGLLCWIAAVLALAGAFFCFGQGQWMPGLAAGAAAGICGLLGAMLVGRYRRGAAARKSHWAQHGGQIQEWEEALETWSSQRECWEQLERARQDAKTAQSHVRALQAMARRAEKPQGADSLDFSLEETESRISRLEPELTQARTALAQCTGAAQTSADPAVLRARLEQQQARLRELERIYQALEYAQAAQNAAEQELQRRFAPPITRLAGEYLKILTDGVYDRISVGADLSIQAARAGETTLRAAQWRSDGTGDLMYLALRLAVWEILSPEAPLVLDDALVRFDSERLEKAMELLAQIADRRQILLFSCQRRELDWVNR